MTSRRSREFLKRRREGYQLFLQPGTDLPPQQCSRTEGATLPAHSSASYPPTIPTPTAGYGVCVPFYEAHPSPYCCAGCATSTSTSATITSASSNLPSPPRQQVTEARDANTLVLQLRPVRVDVVRGDTGRRTSFILETRVLYAWHHGNHVYRSHAEKEDAGVELQETVVCQVCAEPSVSPTWTRDGLPANTEWQHQHTLLRNEEAAAATAAGATRVMAIAGEPNVSALPTSALFTSPLASYVYEATQVSRRRHPPSRPSWQSTDVVAHLGSSTPALFVECLLKCVHDEAALPDECGWVYLYHGRHILTEMGRTRLMQDLFAHGYYNSGSQEAVWGGESSRATLTICVFRKH